MNTSITTCLLAGALAASLFWNAKGLLPCAAMPAPQDCSTVPDLERLELSAEQTRALEAWRANSCEPNCSMDREAEAKLDELHAALRNPAATVETLHELAAEVSRLRAHALDACVDSVVEVRRVLTNEQLGTLMQCCNLQPVTKL